MLTDSNYYKSDLLKTSHIIKGCDGTVTAIVVINSEVLK